NRKCKYRRKIRICVVAAIVSIVLGAGLFFIGVPIGLLFTLVTPGVALPIFLASLYEWKADTFDRACSKQINRLNFRKSYLTDSDRAYLEKVANQGRWLVNKEVDVILRRTIEREEFSKHKEALKKLFAHEIKSEGEEADSKQLSEVCPCGHLTYINLKKGFSAKIDENGNAVLCEEDKS